MIKIYCFIIIGLSLLGCFTSAGDKNLFEFNSRIGQTYMVKFLNDNSTELQNPSSSFIKEIVWSECLELNDVHYMEEITLPKTPSETLSDGYGDCVNLSILSIWNYGYENITGWILLGNRDNEYHQVVVYNNNMIISSRTTYYIKTIDDIYDIFDKKYNYYNFYSADFKNEISDKVFLK
jgi:hypothetical protein